MGEYRYNNRVLVKIICVLLVFILTATTFSSPILAYGITKSKIKDMIIEKIKTAESSSQRINLQTFLKNFSLKRIEIIPLHVVTKYNNTEKTTKLKLLLPTIIDVDGDGDKDVRVSVFRRLSIDFHPLAFSIKTSLLVKRLPGMDNIKNTSFEIYLEYLPRLLSKISGGTIDRIRMGYQSPDGEEIPDSCTITHTYVPHLVYPRRMPTHRFSVNPGSIAGKNKLNLLVSIADTEGDTVFSQNVFKINYDPAVKADFSIDRMKKSKDITIKLDASHESKVKLYYTKDENNDNDSVGFLIDKLSSFTFNIALTKLFRKTSKVEYKQISTNPVNVTLFRENSKDFYFYVKNLSEQITLSFLPECEGWMELDTFDKTISEIGFCDDLTDPGWRLYFNDLPTFAKLNWSLSQKYGLEEGKLHLFSDTNGCSAHLNTNIQDILKTGFNADVNVDVLIENDANMTMSWNLSNHHLKIEQSKTDLNLSMSICGENGNTFEGACLLKHIKENPLDIYYDDLRDEKINFSISGRYFDLYNLDVKSYVVGKGNFTLQIAHMLRKNIGGININLYAKNNGSNIICNCSFSITGGIEIYGLVLGYNGQWYNASYVYVAENDTFYFEFGGEINIDYYFSSDFSSGYISIGGSLNIDVDMSLNWNGTYGGIIGKILLNSIGDRFNISWNTIDDERRFTLDGGALVSLSDFRMWFGEIIDVSIPTLSGSLKIENMSKQTGAFELEFQGSGSLYLNTSFNCSKSNQSDVQLNISIDAMIETGDTSALIAASWDNYNVTSFEVDIRNGGFLTINDLDIRKTVDGNQSLEIENLTAQLNGLLQVNITRANATRNTFVVTTEDADVYLHVDCFNTSLHSFNTSWQWLDLGSINISMSSTGRTIVSLLNITNESYVNPYYAGELLEWNNITMSISANDSSFILSEFFIEHLSNYSTIKMKNLSINDGYSKINFDSAINRTDMIIAFANLRFNNSPTTIILLDHFSFNLVLGGVVLPIPTRIYSGKLKGGVFETKVRLFDIISVEITNGSAIDNLGVDVVPPLATSDFHLNIYLDEPASYLFFEVSNMEYEKEYILIDTHNTSTKLNLTFLVPAQHIGSSTISDSAGFRIDNVTIKSDRFIINTPNLFLYPENVNIYDFNISGYIHLQGGGNIWVLVNGIWHPLYQYNGSLTVTPGHLKIEIDGDMSIDRVIPLSDNSTVTIKGNLSAENCVVDIWWERLTGSIPDVIKFEFNGNLNIEEFLLKVEYNDNNGLDKFIVSLEILSLLTYENASITLENSSLKTYLHDGQMLINDFYLSKVNDSETTLSSAWQNLDVSGPAYFNISSKNEPLFNLSGSAESFELTNFELTNIDKTIQIGSITFYGEFSISTLPVRDDSSYYIGFNVEKIDGVLDVNDITMPSGSFDIIDSFYFDGTGDIQFENWVAISDSDTHVLIEIKNNLNINYFELGFDNGATFKIERLNSGTGYITSGYIHAAWNIDLDADGMVFLDSGPENDPISFHNLKISYNRNRLLGWGMRLRFPDHYFDADLWCIQWDPLWYNPNTGVFIIKPLSIQIDGEIQTGRVDLDMYDGNYWYSLGRWPIIP